MSQNHSEPVPDSLPSTMRAARLHGIGDLRVEEVSCPTPGPGEVLLLVASVGVCGSDVHYYREGRIGDQIVRAPLILGHEFSAYPVAHSGASTPDAPFPPGQLVAVDPAVSCGRCEPCQHGHPNLCLHVRFCGTPPVDGVLAEYVVMPAENCFPLPQAFTPEAGALLEPLGIAIHSVDLAHLKPGQTVAVLGAGPIGLLVAAVARAAGAGEVFVTEPLAYRRQFALDYQAAGTPVADAAFNPDDTDVVAEILRLTGGRGVDVVFEAAGAPDTPQQAVDVACMGGSVILVGIPSDDALTLKISAARRKGLTLKTVRRMKHTYPRAIRLVQAGMVDVKPLATHLFPLGRIGEAFELVAGYGGGVLRAVIEVSR